MTEIDEYRAKDAHLSKLLGCSTKGRKDSENQELDSTIKANRATERPSKIFRP